MWLPKSEQEIMEALDQGTVEESATLDFKRELGSKNKEIAKDIAAMATDGGVIIYGIGEDENQSPFSMPLPLSKEADRINAIASSAIQEPPTIRITTIPTQDDPSRGYLVVEIPPSPRAPHMVVVKGDNRYYGRDARGNRLLSEGDIARLYERRIRWETKNQNLLDEVVALAPVGPHPDFGFLHFFSQPVVSDEDLLEKALPGQYLNNDLRSVLEEVRTVPGWNHHTSPDGFGPGRSRQVSDGWVVSMGLEPGHDQVPRKVLDLRVQHDGGIRLFYGRAGERYTRGDRPPLLLFETSITDLVVRSLAFAHLLYRRASYLGPVDLGVAVTNIEGGLSCWIHMQFNRQRFSSALDRPDYRRTVRVLAHDLSDPLAIADRLVGRFIAAITDGELPLFDKKNE